MTIQPANVDDLSQAFSAASRNGERVTAVDLRSINSLVEHFPEDMTATVQGGMLLSDFQQMVGRHDQWLPIDPSKADQLTIADLLSFNAQGPRRCGHGTIRDHLLGLKVVLADGRLIKAGGKVVKNVAGYDLCKLFVGHQNSLGVIVEATFKLKPKPESETFVRASLASLEAADALLTAISESDLVPMVCDFHNFSESVAVSSNLSLIVGLSGNAEDVAYQVEKAKQLGISETASLDYDRQFWAVEHRGSVRHISVLPSKLIHALAGLSGFPFLARAGNGLIYYRGGPEPAKTKPPHDLSRRIKDAFDPKHILPDIAE